MSTYVDRTAAAVEHCETMATQHPELAEKYYNKISQYCRDKLWHQLTITILDFLSDNINRGIYYAELYDKVVLAVDNKLHPLSSARMAVLTANELNRSQNDLPAAKAIIENSQEKLINNLEATIYLQSKHSMLTLEQLLKVPNFTIESTTEEIKTSLSSIHDIIDKNGPIIQELSALDDDNPESDSALVHAAHYETAMNYYKLLGPPEAFYDQAMNYLNYISPDITNTQLAIDLCLAALTGDGVYNLTAVEQTPVVQKLANSTDTVWLLELLQATASGDVPRFQEISTKYTQNISTQPALIHRASIVQEKLTLTALVLTILRKDSHERCLTFNELKDSLHLDSIEQVEWVLMRAFSVKLLIGKIDQVEQNVDITWVQPRVLSIEQMKDLSTKFGEWASKVSNIKDNMTEQTSSALLQ